MDNSFIKDKENLYQLVCEIYKIVENGYDHDLTKCYYAAKVEKRIREFNDLLLTKKIPI